MQVFRDIVCISFRCRKDKDRLDVVSYLRGAVRGAVDHACLVRLLAPYRKLVRLVAPHLSACDNGYNPYDAAVVPLVPYPVP